MSSNVLFFGWNRSIYGREKESAAHFQDFMKYLEGLLQSKIIKSFEPVFLDLHGGDMNGFFFIKGDGDKIDTLIDSEDWIKHTIRANFHLEGFGVVRGVTGDMLLERMDLWAKSIPG
jgi:hypothetical protein